MEPNDQSNYHAPQDKFKCSNKNQRQMTTISIGMKNMVGMKDREQRENNQTYGVYQRHGGEGNKHREAKKGQGCPGGQRL